MKIEAIITIELPVSASDNEIKEWLEFNLQVIASMSGKNPLAGYDLECENVSIN